MENWLFQKYLQSIPSRHLLQVTMNTLLYLSNENVEYIFGSIIVSEVH